MKKLVLLNILLGILLISCSAQNERIENKIMECSYHSYADEGIQLKQLISDYQKLLIDEEILADDSGKSYRNVLQNIADGNDFNKAPSKFFINELQKIDKPNTIKAQDCQKIIVIDSSLYDLSKLKGLEQAITNAQHSNDIQPSLIARDFLKVLSDEDFELDFYKLRTFFLFEMMNPNDGINRKLPKLKADKTEYDLSNALNIYLDDKSQIIVNEKKLSIEELKKLIREYELKNKSESIISLKTERETSYKTYIEVQNAMVGEINNLREQLSKERYNVELDKLSEEQFTEIKKIYPQKIVE